MGSCKLELPATGGADALNDRLNNMLPNLGNLSKSLLADAAEEFFRETLRWRYVANRIELSAGDQRIDLDMPDGVEMISVYEPVYLQDEHCCEHTVHRKSDGTRGDFRNSDTGYTHHYTSSYSGNFNGRMHGNYGGNYRRSADSLGFYEPHPGLIMFSDCLDCDYTFRAELLLTPSGFDGLDCVPASIMSAYREGIVSLAIVKALKMPNKPWTEDVDQSFMLIHMADAEKAKKKAIMHHRNDTDPHRPHGDRLGALREMSSAGRNNRGYY